jgi:hypothetical protein
MNLPFLFARALRPFKPFSQLLIKLRHGDVGALGSDARGAYADARVCHVNGYGYFLLRLQTPQPSRVFIQAAQFSALSSADYFLI